MWTSLLVRVVTNFVLRQMKNICKTNKERNNSPEQCYGQGGNKRSHASLATAGAGRITKKHKKLRNIARKREDYQETQKIKKYHKKKGDLPIKNTQN